MNEVISALKILLTKLIAINLSVFMLLVIMAILLEDKNKTSYKR